MGEPHTLLEIGEYHENVNSIVVQQFYFQKFGSRIIIFVLSKFSLIFYCYFAGYLFYFQLFPDNGKNARKCF